MSAEPPQGPTRMPRSNHGPDPSRYRVRPLDAVTVTARGVGHGVGAERVHLPWNEIRCVIAAEIGEPEGVRGVVFDLLGSDDAGDWIAFRLVSGAGCEAIELARALQIGMGPGRASASLESLAADGMPTRCYPDLQAFEREARQLLAAFLDDRDPGRCGSGAS